MYIVNASRKQNVATYFTNLLQAISTPPIEH